MTLESRDTEWGFVCQQTIISSPHIFLRALPLLHAGLHSELQIACSRSCWQFNHRMHNFIECSLSAYNVHAYHMLHANLLEPYSHWSVLHALATRGTYCMRKSSKQQNEFQATVALLPISFRSASAERVQIALHDAPAILHIETFQSDLKSVSLLILVWRTDTF